MTKYILHGGFARRENEDNDLFHEEILNDIHSEATLLLVYFAVDEEKLEDNKTRDIAYFERFANGLKLNFLIADENNFQDQVKKSDVIYISGGTTLKALEILQRFEDLKPLFEGKTIAGESAGAYVLSTYFYSKTANGLYKGLGCVPVKTICHFEGENEDKLNEAPDNLEKLLLPDFKFKVFTHG